MPINPDQLCAMGERPLHRMPEGQATLRLMIDSSFDDDVVIRVEHDIAETRLVSTVREKSSLGHEARELVTTSTIISDKKWRAIEVLYEDTPF
ncbi:hypothetical protein [Parahaliea mediterranea]|uniref:Uncharacterized protein n=1 Tax=Parahaliea mediterranea TaxID=651086 RepID=A0A939DDM7_9GAMM|nr:hypothetical protein [Parahaliea mediterranea]MBN7796325.1 hypothetical protein [Parahaliea mediterranea]